MKTKWILFVVLALVAIPAMADAVDEAPSPHMVIDRRPPAWSPFQTNINWSNIEQPTPIIPKGWGVTIIEVAPLEPESTCRATDNQKCAKACGAIGKTMVSCEIDIVWNPDGSTTRQRICGCDNGGKQSPQVAGSSIDVLELRFPEPEYLP